MDNFQAQVEIQKQLREQQGKFVYYIIALCVAAIGFSIHQTFEQKLSYYHTLLAISMITWCLSIFCGFQFVQIHMKALVANADYFQIIRKHKELNQKEENQVRSILTDKIETYSIRSQSNFMWQQYWFYIGIVLFLIWRVFEMGMK